MNTDRLGSPPSKRSALIAVGRLLIILGILAVWQAAAGRLLPLVWLSSPLLIASALCDWLAHGVLWYHLQATFLTVVLGYALGAGIGVITGLTLGLMPRVERVLSPFIVGLWCLPKIALLPLFVITLGIGIESKVALVALVVVFLLLYSAIDGVRDVDPDLVDMLRVMGATPWEIMVKALFPATLPWIYTGLRVSIGYSLSTTVVGELLSSNRGLGYLIQSAAAQFDAAQVFAAVFVLVVLSLLVYETLTRMEARSNRWRR